MSLSTQFLRYASPNERRTISREDVGFYNALVVAAIYEVASEYIDIESTRSFITPLKRCIQEYPFLSVVVKNKDTEKPSYERVWSVNLENHLSILRNDQASLDEEITTIQNILPPILDRPWPADIPPWRIVVLPLSSLPNSPVKRCFIAFSFSHTLGDGMVGPIFHRTFLNAWRQTTAVDRSESFLVTPPNRPLTEPFDTRERLPISWKYLLTPIVAVYLPKFLANFLGLRVSASTIDAGTWIGAPMFFDPSSLQTSRVKILEIEAPLVRNALQVSRAHDTKLTATFHQMIVRALSRAIPDRAVTNFVSGTPVDMRGSIGTPAHAWGLYVSAHYEVHSRVSDPTESALSNQMWAAASSMSRSLAECGSRLQDQAIGLLRYLPSIRNWMLSKIGHQRDSSYEFSNLLAFDGGADGRCNISKMVFTQPGNVASAPLVFNVISIKGGSLVCTVSWQIGALGVPHDEEMVLVNDICSSLRADFEALRA